MRFRKSLAYTMQSPTHDSTVDLPTPEAMSRFLKGLRHLVLDEAVVQRQQIHQSWSRPLPARVADGRAVEGLRVAVARDGLITLAAARNSSRFREGDILCLHRGDPFDTLNPMVTLEQDDGERLVVSIQGHHADWRVLKEQPTGWILDEGYLDLSQYVLAALDEAGDTFVGRSQILPLLMGCARPRMDPTRYERALDLAEAAGLNESQAEALSQAYATDLTYLIQGPPGTGKTRVLAHLAGALVAEGARVLITAFTHRAINNALNTLARFAPETPAIKVGQSARADDLRVENYETFAASPLADEPGGYVVGATPFAARSSRLTGVGFEWVIFDEASQITLPLAIMGMLAGQRYVFVGDQRQLPPVLVGPERDSVFAESIFASLADRGFDTMLTETYRLNDVLAAWPSEQFYDGRLTPAAGVAKRRIDYPRPPARLLDALDPDEPRLFWDLDGRNATTRSFAEASGVVDLILSVLACGLPPGEIGVVVPYRAQAREIHNLLRRAVPAAEIRRPIVVDTVERMQGQERELIILSLTTSNPAFASRLADFFFQPERLNVAITRARTKLIILGSRHVLNAAPEQPEQQECVALFRDLLACTPRYPFAD